MICKIGAIYKNYILETHKDNIEKSKSGKNEKTLKISAKLTK